MQIFTYTITGSDLQINAADGAMYLSVETAANSSCTITGNVTFKGVVSTPVVLIEQRAINYSAVSANSPLDGIVITWVSGTIDTIIGF